VVGGARTALALALLSLTALGLGCGDDEPAVPAVGPTAGSGGGSVVWALPDRPHTLDPLFARTPADRLAARQLHEPLVEELSGPFGDPRRVDGLALSATQTRDPTVWRLRLRPGVRFQDGTPFNAAAVLANAERWQAYPELSGVPPSPEAFVFAPKPDEVRFKLAVPDPNFDRVLASPSLGIVSPQALRRAGGGELGFRLATESGTGPFEPRERTPGSLLLARNALWWGSGRPALGPAIDQLNFVVVPQQEDRVSLLRAGEAQVATGFDQSGARDVKRDPLLTVVSTAGAAAIAAERSIRGIPAEEPVPALNGLWQTRIDAG
jgi:ABC-type transport system substrate-binding protein